MKKTTNKLIAILLMLALSIGFLALAACDGTTAPDDNAPPVDNIPVDETLAGKYVLCSFTEADGESIDMELFREVAEEADTTIEDSYCFDFFDDGTCSMTFEDTTNDGTYVKQGDTVTVSLAGDEADLPLDGDLLTWYYPDGQVLVFEKQ